MAPPLRTLLHLAQLSLALAAPDAIARAACNRDNCLRAVIASNAKPYASSASKDCVSFFQKTVTPCASAASTTFITSVVTETADAPTTTLVVPATATVATETEVVNVPYTVTAATDFVPTIVATQNVQATITTEAVITSVVTEGDTITSTTSVYSFGPRPPARRDLDGRADTVCAVGTAIPSAVPTYASACSGTVRYSSACSCIGITEQTITATLPVVTSTVFQTATVTPAVVTETITTYTPVTATITVTSSQEVDVTATQQVPTTVIQTLDPTTATTTNTVINTVTTTNTVYVPGPTQFCQMYLRASGGTVDGQFIGADVSTSTNFLATNPSNRNIYRLDGASRLRVVDGPLADRGSSCYQTSPYLYLLQDSYWAANYLLPLSCTIDGSLELFCRRYPARAETWSDGYVLTNGNGKGKHLWTNLGNPPAGSTTFRLYAVPVNCVT